jgi:hypothetical protein
MRNKSTTAVSTTNVPSAIGRKFFTDSSGGKAKKY